ncbi:MAG: virulence factor SrfC family protein [Pseudomonadota bacterium]
MPLYVFPSDNDRKIQRRAGEVLALIRGIQEWSETSHLSPKEKDKFLSRVSKRFKAVSNIESVALHPMTVGVFGPSQSGKSYLVNELTRGHSSNLEIVLGQHGVKDFLKDINPEGGQESTAQVTRFTCNPRKVLDPSFPVHVDLLSKTDLVKIFVNGFAYECGPTTKIDRDEFEQFQERCRSAPEDRNTLLTMDDIFDVENYVINELERESLFYLGELDYWQFFRSVVAVKGFEVHVQYLSWLWGRSNAMTELFDKLAQTVHGLGSTEVWVQPESLIPRFESILDVQSLKFHLRKTDDGLVRIMNMARRAGSIPRSLLAALTAELTLEVPRDRAAEFMQYCDILDFPGARARGSGLKLEDLEQAPATPEEVDLLAEVFLRGKIAYLFDRYVEMRDINGLVLCCPPGNPEALSLPYLVQKWIKRSHGATSAERHDKPLSLYVAFTKFDDTLVKKKGGEDPSSPVRWESRLKNAFEDFFARIGKATENWVLRWDRRGPFSNCYWLRNPNVDQVVFERHNGSELVREDYKPWLAQLFAYYSDNSLVRSHFSDPVKSWNEVTSPGRNGIQYLLDALCSGLEPGQKSRMLNLELDEIFQALERISAPLMLDDASVEKAQKEADQRIKELDELEYEAPVFGHVLQRLVLTENQIETLYDEAYKRGGGGAGVGPGNDFASVNGPGGNEPAAGADGVRRRRAVRARPDGRVEQQAEQGRPVQQVRGIQGAVRPPAEAYRFAELVMKRWEENLANLENDPHLLGATGLTPDWFRSVTDTIVKAAYLEGERFAGLPTIIATGAGSSFRNQDPGNFRRTQAFITCHLIGNYVCFLGDAPPSVPELGGASPKASGDGFPGEAYLAEWMRRLKNMYVALVGARTEAGNAIEAGRALRELLEKYQAKLW